MKTTKHTPGPWEVESHNDGPFISCELGSIICPVIGARANGHDDRHGGNDGHNAERMANARLIAKAPDLLTALDGFEPVDVVNFAAWMERYQLAMNKARTLIAQATGEE